MIQQHSECPATAYPECLERLASIETKLDTILRQQGDVERRLRSLEETRSQARGGAQVAHIVALGLGGVAGALASWAMSFIKHP